MSARVFVLRSQMRVNVINKKKETRAIEYILCKCGLVEFMNPKQTERLRINLPNAISR